MAGDDRVRFCGHCRQHVYNLSALSRASAERLLLQADRPPCVRLYRRPDGTVVTGDCLALVAALRRRLALGLTAAATVLLGLLAWAGSLSGERQGKSAGSAWVRSREPFRTLLNWLDPQSEAVMGKPAPPLPPPAPPRLAGEEKVEPPMAPGPK